MMLQTCQEGVSEETYVQTGYMLRHCRHEACWACALHGSPSWPVCINTQQYLRAYLHAANQVPIWMPMDMPQPAQALPHWTAVDALSCLTFLLGT